MYELIQVGKNTFYMDCPSKVGFFKTGDNEVVLIDAGSDKDAAKKVKRILDEQGWNLKAIYITHSHADHIGGNQYLQNQTGCKIYAHKIERSASESPIFEPALLYGGFPLSELRNKFVLAKEAEVEKLTEDALPEGMTMIELPGHSYDMVGYRTSDNVLFLADSVISEESLEKHKVFFLYDVKAHLETLEMIKTLEADCFVPSHARHTTDIVELTQKNIDKTNEIIEAIKKILETPKSFENLLAEVFTHFDMNMEIQQRMLAGFVIKSFLAYMKSEGYIDFSFENNIMIWHKAEKQEQ